MSDIKASIRKKFAEIEQSYTPKVSGKDFNGRIKSLRDAIKQLNSPVDMGVRLVQPDCTSRKHKLVGMDK